MPGRLKALSRRVVKLEEELALARLHRFAPRSEKHIDRIFNEAEDVADDRRQLLDEAEFLGFTVEIVRRVDEGFKILPRRWVVERTFGWHTRYRRLVEILKPASMSPKPRSMPQRAV